MEPCEGETIGAPRPNALSTDAGVAVPVTPDVALERALDLGVTGVPKVCKSRVINIDKLANSFKNKKVA